MRSKADCKKDLKSSVIGCKNFFILCFCLEERCVFPRQTEETCSVGRQKSKYDVCQLSVVTRFMWSFLYFSLVLQLIRSSLKQINKQQWTVLYTVTSKGWVNIFYRGWKCRSNHLWWKWTRERIVRGQQTSARKLSVAGGERLFCVLRNFKVIIIKIN